MIYKKTWTYQGIVELPTFDGYIFNHGTESKKADRTNTHIKDCKDAGLVYNVIYEEADRLFGSDVISAAYDSTYVKKLVDELTKLKAGKKAQMFKDWEKCLSLTDPILQGYYNAIKKANLSETECAFIPAEVSKDELNTIIEKVNKWYFSTKSLRVSAKAYKDKTADEKKMAAKPIPIAFNKKIINAIHYKVSEAKLIAMKLTRAQSITLAYTLSCMSIFKNAKFRVVITADDIEKHQETYDAIKNNSRFEFIICESDEEVIEEYLNMTIKPDLDIMNPPYDGSLHLEILSKVLENKKPGATVVSVQPARWIEDPLAEYKQGSDYKKYKDTIISRLSGLKLIDQDTASFKFNILLNSDLGIYIFNDNSISDKLFTVDINNLITKIRSKITTTMKDKAEQLKLDGVRVEIHEMLPPPTGSKGGQSISAKTASVALVNLRSNSVFIDGYNDTGAFWTEDGRAKNGSSKTTGACFPYSIKVADCQTGLNLVQSCRCEFYKNLIYMIKFDSHMPLRFLPYMEDYSHVWTDEDYCKFFDLTEDESKFMCRKVEDYRVKDFIKYINLDED